MDERVKHRLIGFLVIFAVIAILAPIVIKTTKPVWKSIQTSTTFRIPHSPLRKPHMVMKEEAHDWKKPLQVAAVSLDKPVSEPLVEHKAKQVRPTKKVKITKKLLVSKLEPIPALPEAPKLVLVKPVKILKKQSSPLGEVIKVSLKKTPEIASVKSKQFRIVLGTFKKDKNVTNLLKKLEKLGYKAHTKNIKTKKGLNYKQVILTQSYKQTETVKLLQYFNDTLHVDGVLRSA
jgi:cell division septation protein DedD